MPAYYDDEENDDSMPDMGPDVIELVPGINMGTGQMSGQSFPSASQIETDRKLSSMLPAPDYSSGVQAGPYQATGAATREMLTGRPGLFVQGGPGVPAGTISVNGVLERSQAAPQPIPWWITAADEFKEQRRQEDFLKSTLANAPGGDGTAAIERAQQLEGILGFDADRRRGVPVQEALMRHAPKMYFKSPASVTRLEAALARSRPTTQPFTPTVTDVGGQQLFQISPQRFSFGPRQPQSKPTGLSPEGQLKALTAQLRDVQKQEEAASFSRDKTAMSKLAEQRQKIMGKMEKLQGGEQPATAPAAAATQPVPKSRAGLQLANQLRALHPDWTNEQLIKEVATQLGGK